MALKIHDLPGDPGKRQKKKRVGRGESSGWGRTAGKGNKGAKARSGRAKGRGFEGGQTPLLRRIPKYGFSNAAFQEKRAHITLIQLNRFDDGAVVDRDALHKAGLIRKGVERVKLICKGALKKKLTVRLQACSPGAQTAVEACGGKWEAAGS